MVDEVLETRDFRQLAQTAIAQGSDAVALQPVGGPVQWIELKRVIGRLGPVDVVAATFADLTLAWDPGKLAIVYADPDPTKVGYHVKLGANGAGSWIYSNVFRGFTGGVGPAGPPGGALVVEAEAGTAYTFALTDAQKHKRFTAGTAIAATVPPNSTHAFAIGTRIRVTSAGVGQVTLTPGAVVTLNSRGGALKSAGQFAVFEIQKVAADAWDCLGDLTV